MGLREEISAKRKEIVVDSYAMSIGEIVNLYKDGELDVHPEFQRFYRWDEEQKTKLIESILLGIPIPPIFVSQKLDGKWDVIDGQQRISTVLQFLGVLEKDNGEKYSPLILQATKFLPSLGGVCWNNDELFSPEQKITFKREKFSFTIIKEADKGDISKYEMFQRLNTGGTHLSAQELRNCLMIMINKSLYELMNKLHDYEDFKECTPITDNKVDGRYDLELIVRYLLYVSFSDEFLQSLDKGRSMDNFLTEQLEQYALDAANEKLINESEEKFYRIFKLLREVYGENVFKKYQNGKFKGPFMLASFESIVPGIFPNIEYWENNKNQLQNKIIKIYTQEPFITASKRGTRALDRMAQLIIFSRNWFNNEN